MATNTNNTTNKISINIHDLIALRKATGKLKFASNKKTNSFLTGSHFSKIRGPGLDYLESRHYLPGDDIKNIDWRVTARSGQTHTKIFHEEKEKPVMVIIDFNTSMFFGTKNTFKIITAAKLAALIAWITVNNHDRIGALFFKYQQHQEIKPTSGKNGVLSLVKQLSNWVNNEQPAQKTERLSSSLEKLRRLVKPGSLIFILSDFYCLDETSERHISQLSKHNSIIACPIFDQLEHIPPPPNNYGMSNGKNVIMLDLSTKNNRQAYQSFFADHQKKIESMCNKFNIPLMTFLTHQNVAKQLKSYLNFNQSKHINEAWSD